MPPRKSSKSSLSNCYNSKINVALDKSSSLKSHPNDDNSRRPCGNVVVVADGKRFYNAISIQDEIISINDSVDVLRRCRNSGTVRETNLGMILNF